MLQIVNGAVILCIYVAIEDDKTGFLAAVDMGDVLRSSSQVRRSVRGHTCRQS